MLQAHDANAVGALDPNRTTASQDMTKVQLPHHQELSPSMLK